MEGTIFVVTETFPEEKGPEGEALRAAVAAWLAEVLEP